jgi:hypothetical protein
VARFAPSDIVRSKPASADPRPASGGRRPSGTRYAVPADILAALERLFAEPGLDRVAVIYRPLYVRSHLVFIGGRTGSVTRPGRIYTNIPEPLFFTLDRHVVHEYYHVVQQWGRERMTRLGYLLNSRSREGEAHAFVDANVQLYRRYREEFARPS